MEVALTEEESSVLQHALHSYLSDLRGEIGHTDDRKFRDGLKHERATLEGVFAKLDEASRRPDGGDGGDGSGPRVVRLVSVWWADTASR